MSIYIDLAIRAAVKGHRESMIVSTIKARDLNMDGDEYRRELDEADNLLIEQIHVLLTSREEAVREDLKIR